MYKYINGPTTRNIYICYVLFYFVYGNVLGRFFVLMTFNGAGHFQRGGDENLKINFMWPLRGLMTVLV
jgi:hypothetical protein